MGLFFDILKNAIGSSTRDRDIGYNPIPEEQYGGVPLSKLKELARQIRSGTVYTQGKYLYCRFNTTSGRPGPSIQYVIVNNKLRKMTYRNYPGQLYFPEDEFMERANEQFVFEEQ